MSAISGRLVAAPRVPLRAVAILALLVLALVASAVLIGSQQRRLPPPFGPAGNGLIPYVSSGDIFVGDPVTGTSRLLIGEAGDDSAPAFSPDGTQIAFLRDVGAGTGHLPVDIYVAKADGTDRRRITSRPIADLVWASWSPDSRSLAVIRSDASVNQLDLLDTSGNGRVTRVAAAVGADEMQFRPPDGHDILFRALVRGKYGLFVMNADGTNLRTLIAPTIPADVTLGLRGAVYSADGSRIFFQQADPTSPVQHYCCRLWVMNADGTDAHEFVPPGTESWDGEAVVSPDGSRIAYWHNPNNGPPHGVSVVRADGTGPVIETGPKLSDTAHWIWAPDSSKILMYPDDGSSASAYLLDPAGGPWETVPWTSDADLDWQRVAR